MMSRRIIDLALFTRACSSTRFFSASVKGTAVARRRLRKERELELEPVELMDSTDILAL